MLQRRIHTTVARSVMQWMRGGGTWLDSCIDQACPMLPLYEIENLHIFSGVRTLWVKRIVL